MAGRALFILGLVLYFPGEGSFAFITGAQRRTSLRHNQRLSTAQSGATSTVVRRPCLQYADSSQQLMEYFQYILQVCCCIVSDPRWRDILGFGRVRLPGVDSWNRQLHVSRSTWTVEPSVCFRSCSIVPTRTNSSRDQTAAESISPAKNTPTPHASFDTPAVAFNRPSPENVIKSNKNSSKY